MNKKEITNLNNLIQIEARNSFYDKDMTTIKAIERTCNFLEYENFYRIANKEILDLMKYHNIINYICYTTIIELFDNIEKYFKIELIINRELLINFYNDISIINDEIKYINEEIYNCNCKKLNIIHENFIAS